MHEASICQSLVEQVRGCLPDGATPTLVRIDVGQLEHLDDEVMGAMWSAMTQDTDLSGTVLEIEHTPVRVRCGSCGAEYRPEDLMLLVCPDCGSARPELLAGTGVILRTIEAEQEG